MNKLDDLDKTKIKEILNELSNLKKYSNDLANNTRGEKLESYIDNLSRNVVLLENKIETLYDESAKINENVE